mmetsp:Transcript_12004/g.36594  ORF Transcript_12004/g.36594 Transcript_12004/m.36594 type:complete len:180 (+) Transcript_12004:189-728(+)
MQELYRRTLHVGELTKQVDTSTDRISSLLAAADNNASRLGDLRQMESLTWAGENDLCAATQLSHAIRVENVLRQVRDEAEELWKTTEELLAAADVEDLEDLAEGPSDDLHLPRASAFLDKLEDVKRGYTCQLERQEAALADLTSYENISNVRDQWMRSRAERVVLRKWFATIAALAETL